MSGREPAPQRAGDRIPSLDGLRALSITGVLIGHGLAEYRLRHPIHGLGMLVSYGGLGVTVFFAISGFLITSLLVAEHDRAGTISLSQFYLRRAFRILPAFWAYLAVIFLATATPATELRDAFLFLTDYRRTSWLLGHTWSLSVEEQFYLLWPLALALLGQARGLRMSVALLVIVPAVRLATYVVDPSILGVENMMHTRVDSLMVGCAVALLRARDGDHAVLRIARRGWLAAASAVFLLVVSPGIEALWFRYHLPFRYHVIGLTLESLAVGSVLVWAIENPRALVGRFLNWAPVAHVGVISYSLYLWQQCFLLKSLAGAGLPRIALHVAAALVAAELSYRIVERPFLSARARFIAMFRRPAAALE